MEGNGFRIGVVARRLTFDGELIERMEAQIGRARAILTAAYKEHLMLIEKEFAGLLDSDMKFVRRLRDFPLDLVGWLGSDKAAASAVSTGRHKQVILR